MNTYELAHKLAVSFDFAGVDDIHKQYDGKDVFIARFKELQYTGLPIFILCTANKAEFAYPEVNEKLFRLFK